ncbi:DotU family type IV/VI secretion system protein, partial [Escherichia coli]
FTGQYRSQDDERREDVIRALTARVPAFTFAQDAPVVVRAPGYRAGRTMYWLSWVAGIVTLAGLWCVLSSVLADQVARLTGQG